MKRERSRFVRRRPRRALFRLGGATLALALLWAIGLVAFVASIPGNVADPEQPTDAVVVLTGGSERLQEGLRLLVERRARKLLVSGVHQEVDLAELLQSLTTDEQRRLSSSIVGCCISLGHSADNTVGNARETAEWMAREAFRSLRLVTADYHMPRSLLEFRRAMPDVAILPHPVFPQQVMREDWWRRPGTASLLVSEYHKYLVALVRGWAGDLPQWFDADE